MLLIILLMSPFVLHSLYVLIRHFAIWKLTDSWEWQVDLEDVSNWNFHKWRYRLNYHGDITNTGWVGALVAEFLLRRVGKAHTKRLLAKKEKQLEPVADCEPIPAGSWK